MDEPRQIRARRLALRAGIAREARHQHPRSQQAPLHARAERHTVGLPGVAVRIPPALRVLALIEPRRFPEEGPRRGPYAA